MHRFLLLISLTFIINQSIAQMPGGGGFKGGVGGGKMANAGHFYGRVVDEKTGKGIEFASVQLTQSKFDSVSKTKKDIIVSGQLTTANGDFSLENLPVFGSFQLSISAMGYKPYQQQVSFNVKGAKGGDSQQLMNAVDKDLGNIAISLTSVVLQEVTVDGSAPTFELKVDKKVYNVEKDQTSTGGTAEDVLKNVPSVNVDIDGNVTMRNASPQIFVDGRPTTLSIDQIPADAIQSIEVISNPSAKYDASGGGGGILNIVLKKNKRIGYNGSIRAGVDSRGRINLGGDLNARQQKINLFVSGNFNQRKSQTFGQTDRSYLFSDPDIHLKQFDTAISKGFFGFGKAGFDWFIDNRNTLTLSGTYNRGSFNPLDNNTITSDTLNSGGSISTSSSRVSSTQRNFQNIGGTLSFKHIYPKDGKEWSGDLNYNGSNSSNVAQFSTRNYDGNGQSLGAPVLQQQNGKGIVDFTTLQTDYVNPVTDKIKIETGARGALRHYSSSVENKLFNNTTNEYVKVPSNISDYKYTDQVYAGYFTFTQQVNKFGYQVGLRGESSFYTGTLLSNNQQFTHEYPISLFPSAYLSYKLNDNNSYQLNYSRKVNRPNFFQLLPYTDYTDSLNLSKGNADLKPEFTNSMEASWQKIFNKKNNMLISAYFKNTTGLITNYQVLEYDSVLMRTVIISTYQNANSSYAYGAELTTQNSVTKWFDLTVNVNAYNSLITGNFNNGTDKTDNIKNQQFSWFTKVNTTFKLPKNFTLQVTGDYKSKTALQLGGGGGRGFGGGGGGMGGGNFFGGSTSTAQGFVKPTYGVDASLKFEFLKNKAASITLGVSDVFKTRETATYSQSEFFNQTTVRRRDQQVFKLNFSYKFGKFDVSLFKRKNNNNNDTQDIPGM